MRDPVGGAAPVVVRWLSHTYTHHTCLYSWTQTQTKQNWVAKLDWLLSWRDMLTFKERPSDFMCRKEVLRVNLLLYGNLWSKPVYPNWQGLNYRCVLCKTQTWISRGKNEYVGGVFWRLLGRSTEPSAVTLFWNLWMAMLALRRECNWVKVHKPVSVHLYIPQNLH